MANRCPFVHVKLSQIEEKSGTITSALVVLGLGVSLFLGRVVIARRFILWKQPMPVGDAKDMTYQMVSVSTLAGLKPCEMVLDSGSLHNWISLEAAVEMDLHMVPVSEQEISACSAIDANGKEVVPLGKVAVTWFWQGSNTPHANVFYVGLRGAFLMTLGSYTLVESNIFTYNKKFVLPLVVKSKKGDKARDNAAQAAQNAKSKKDMEEKDAEHIREYMEFEENNAGGSSSQGNNPQGGSGSSGTTS